MVGLVSGCCGAPDGMITLDGPDYKDIGICPRCKEHCDWVDLEKEEQEQESLENRKLVSLKNYTPLDEIKHVTYSRMEIEQTYNCETCGLLQVINGVCIHIKSDEEHIKYGGKTKCTSK
jgi:hypothetical protein